MASEYKYIPIVYNDGGGYKRAVKVKKKPGQKDYSLYDKNGFGYSEKSFAENTVSGGGYAGSTAVPGNVHLTGAKKVSLHDAKGKPVNIKGIVSTILVICFVFAMLALVLSGNAKISGMNISNSQITSEINQLEKDINDIKLDITLATDLENIQDRAAQLGMSCPDSSRVVYVEGVE